LNYGALRLQHLNNDARPIAALATAVGQAGVAVLRISGHGAFAVADRLVSTKGAAPSARPAGVYFHAFIVDPANGKRLDDGLALIFHAPRSYTGEDTVEIHGHGGTVPSRRLLEAALQAGARLAEPGEFTRRAFLNGRMDLTQAEAVTDLIQARTDRAAAAAREQLDGSLGRKIQAIYEIVTSVCCDVEGMLDIDDGDLPPDFFVAQSQALSHALTSIQALTATWHEGHLLREGALVVIAGRPNVGKSSLLNALLGHDRAIVTAFPGTTRDTIEETCSLDGIPVRLVDTAGLRDATCEIEQIGIERTKAVLIRADAVLVVIDGSAPPCDEDARMIVNLPPERTIVVLNKQDLTGQPTTRNRYADQTLPTAEVSAHTGYGLDHLRRLLGEILATDPSAAGGGQAEHATVSERHRCALNAAGDALHRAAQQLDQGNGPGLILAARDLREAAESIGLITGRTYTDDLLDLIFSRFCIGK
jgi:tRNA modification GTPase